MDWNKRKRELFPEIRNWKDPQNKYRFENNVRGMSYKYWFWFHPTSYKLIYYGYNCISIIFFGLLLLINSIFVRIVVMIFIIYFIYNLIKKIMDHKYIKDVNFYDIYMREYDTNKII